MARNFGGSGQRDKVLGEYGPIFKKLQSEQKYDHENKTHITTIALQDLPQNPNKLLIWADTPLICDYDSLLSLTRVSNQKGGFKGVDSNRMRSVKRVKNE